MGDVCGDNRFEIIKEAKQDLLENTNIDTSKDEMKVIDNFLFRCWQMGWLNKYDNKEKRYFTKDFKTLDNVRDYFNRNQELTLVSCNYVEYWYKCVYYE